MKQIFVLLVVGVFVVGVVRQLIQPEWIQNLAGSNTCWPTRWPWSSACSCTSRRWWRCRWRACSSTWACTAGPLLAYLMADPELSLQSILMVAAVIGRPKTVAYVGLVAVFSIVAGLLYGAWVDGVNPAWIAIGLAAFVGCAGGAAGLAAGGAGAAPARA